MTTDAQLIQSSLQGNKDAFGALVERYQRLACALAYSATGDPSGSEEIAQEAFLVAWRKLSCLEDPLKLRPWLGGIVRNVAGDWLRRRSRESRRVNALEQCGPVPVAPETPSQAAMTREQHELVWQAVGAIPEAYRVALILYYREGMSVQKVADALQLSLDAAKQRLARGRAMLRERMASTVEDTLRRTGPGAGFAVAVVRALPPQPFVAPPHTAARPLPTRSLPRWVAGGGFAAAAAGVALVAGFVALGTPNPPPPRPSEPVRPASVLADLMEPREPVQEPAAPPPQPSPAAAPAPAPELPRQQAPEKPPVYVAPAGYPGTDSQQAVTDRCRGTVSDAQGRPAPGAKVWASRFGNGMRDTRETVTDTQGQYELQLPRGVWWLRARRLEEGGAAPINGRGIFIAEGRGNDLQANVRMERRGMVRGRILDSASGQPIPHARLWTDDDYLVEADTEGRYTLEGVKPDVHCMFALTPGHERRYIQYCTAFRPVSDLDIRLGNAGKVCGRVVGPDGRPIAFAWLHWPKNLWGAGHAVYETCDEQGRFEFDGLPTGEELRLTALIPRYIHTCNEPETDDGTRLTQTCRIQDGAAPPELTFTLQAEPVEEKPLVRQWTDPPRNGAVFGRVLDRQGKPVRDFRIVLQQPHSPSITPEQASSLEINSWDNGFCFTSDDGSFALTARVLEPGKYVRVLATADGSGEAVNDTAVVQPFGAAGRTAPLLFRLGPATGLVVRVLDEAGRPVSGAQVTLLNPMFQNQHREWINGQMKGVGASSRDTDSEGLARFDSLGGATGDVAVQKRGRAVARTLWRGQAELEFVLQPACTVEGTLFDEWRQPLREGVVMLKHTDAKTWDYFSPEDDTYQQIITPAHQGRVHMTDLPPGRYRLYVDDKNIGLLQVGIEPNGRPVTVTPLDSHIFYQEFALEAGETYRFTCPTDSAHLDAREWLARDVSAEDEQLRARILGPWVACSPPGADRQYKIINFLASGRYEEKRFTEGAQPVYAFGHYKFSEGLLRQLTNEPIGLDSECTVSADGATLTLKTVGINRAYTYRRAQSLEYALAEGAAFVGPPRPLPYTPIDPIPVRAPGRSPAGFTAAAF